MRLTSPWLWAGLVMLVGLSLINSRGFTASENRPGDMGEPFVRIGNHYINKHRIDYIVGEDDSLVIVFASGGGNRLRLAGAEAGAMRFQLEPRADVQTRHRGDPQQPYTPLVEPPSHLNRSTQVGK